MARPHSLIPTREAILDFVRTSTAPVGRREIAKAFSVRGGDRNALRQLLKEMAEDGLLDFGRRRKVAPSGTLPEVTVVEVTGTDADGEPTAQPTNWKGDAPAPRILLIEDRKAGALGVGDRALVRLERRGQNDYVGRIIRRLIAAAPRILGIFEPLEDGGGRVKPTDRKARSDFVVDRRDTAGARAGDLVAVELLPRSRNRLGLPAGRIIERFEGIADPRSFSRIAIQEHDIPDVFPAEVTAQAERAKPVSLGNREDLRRIPLVTIDGEDARDFDDAVHAVPDDDAGNPGGFRLLIAIADVAHYARSGDALDREALKRGNSVYFPDRVVPMLPEALSNGLCSLRPDEDRACVAVEVVIDADGNKRRHRFLRGLMRSAGRLTYRQVQRAADGGESDGIPAGILEPLYGAFQALRKARAVRGALDLEIPEKRVILDEDGRVVEIGVREVLGAHMLIEEFMVLANVCAAETLEARRQPCMYRVHESPDPEKVAALAGVLEGIGIPLARGQVIRPKTFNAVLAKVRGQPAERMVNEMILRAQAQAHYAPENAGHFGLGLARYAHFTSPIRRYSDLLVHRALIAGLKLGAGSLPADDAAKFAEWGEHISATERRAAAAERRTVDRYLARHLADRVGGLFDGRINGVTRFGLFITLTETGADGLVPIRSLPDDYYDLDEARHSLAGRFHGRVYRLGDPVEVRLIEADPVSGSIALEIVAGGTQEPPGRHPGRRRAGRQKPAARPANRKGGR